MVLFINPLLLLKLNFMLRYLTGMLLFSWKLPKRECYVMRALGYALVCFLLAFALPVLTENFYYIVFLFLIEALFAVGVIRFCCKAAHWFLSGILPGTYLTVPLSGTVPLSAPPFFSYGLQRLQETVEGHLAFRGALVDARVFQYGPEHLPHLFNFSSDKSLYESGLYQAGDYGFRLDGDFQEHLQYYLFCISFACTAHYAAAKSGRKAIANGVNAL